MKPEKTLSQLLHPLLMVPVATVVFLYLEGTDIYTTLYWIGIWIVGSLVPTTVVTWRTGKKGFNVIKREKRFKAFATGLTTLGIFISGSWYFGAPYSILKIGYVGLFTVLVFALANNYRKVSIHTGSAAGIATVYTSVSIPASFFLFIASLLVGWSRVKLDCHTPYQVVQGWLIGIFCSLTYLLI